MKAGLKFVQEVKTEAKRVSWPSLKETSTTSLVVAIVVFIFGLFFLLADSLIIKILQYIIEYKL